MKKWTVFLLAIAVVAVACNVGTPKEGAAVKEGDFVAEPGQKAGVSTAP